MKPPRREPPPAHRAVARRGTARWGWIAALLLLLSIVALLSTVARELPLPLWGGALGDAGPIGALLLVAGGAAATACGLPRQLVALVAGYAFGIALGFPLALLAAVLGCATTVLLARRWLRAAALRRFPRQIDWLARFAGRDTFLKILVLRLQPLGTNLASNLAAGVIRLPLGAFLSASALGYVPQTLVFVLAGSGIRVGSSVELWLALALLLASIALGLLAWRRHVDADDATA